MQNFKAFVSELSGIVVEMEIGRMLLGSHHRLTLIRYFFFRKSFFFKTIFLDKFSAGFYVAFGLPRFFFRFT